MKKSKIIVPALGILCLSTAAAVTGTVAWFTASRVETITMSNITLVNPETGLAVEVIAGAGTTVANKAVTHANDGTNQGFLRDGSVDVANDKVYKAVLTDDNNYSGYAEVASPYKDVKKYNNMPVYFATSFTMKFKGGTNTDTTVENSLFFSPDLSSATVNTENPENSYKSLRIGMKAGEEWFIWAPFYDSANSNAFKYINGTVKGTNEQTVAAANKIEGNATATSLPNDYDDSTGKMGGTPKTLVNYLGKLPDDNSDLEVTVYTWYEGTDVNCVQAQWSKALDISSSLTFISRKVAA